jgi:hypothetical protein
MPSQFDVYTPSTPQFTNNLMGFGGSAIDPSRQMTVPGYGLGGGMGGNLGPATGLDWNLGTGQLALGGLSAIGNLWTGWNAANLASKQFDFTKKTTETNLRNQAQTYNTTLDDRARVRGAMEGQSQQQVDDYKNANRLRV